MGLTENMKKGRYRHFKGREYMLLDIAIHSETLEKMVVYKALYGEEGIWVRPLEMWVEKVIHGGEEIDRFMFIGEH